MKQAFKQLSSTGCTHLPQYERTHSGCKHQAAVQVDEVVTVTYSQQKRPLTVVAHIPHHEMTQMQKLGVYQLVPLQVHHKPTSTPTTSSPTTHTSKMAAFKYCILALALIGAASASRLELNGITEVLQPLRCLARL